MGKKVFLHDEDLRIIQNGGVQEEYIVLDTEGQMVERNDETNFTRRPVSTVDYKGLFEDAQKSIERKDQLIQELSYRAGQAETELKNSISMIEYKKATLLLESSNTKSQEEKKGLTEKVETLERSVEKSNGLNLLLLIAVLILLLASAGLWFLSL